MPEQTAATSSTEREYRTGSNIPRKETDVKIVDKEAIERMRETAGRTIGPGQAP